MLSKMIATGTLCMVVFPGALALRYRRNPALTDATLVDTAMYAAVYGCIAGMGHPSSLYMTALLGAGLFLLPLVQTQQCLDTLNRNVDSSRDVKDAATLVRRQLHDVLGGTPPYPPASGSGLR